MIPSFQRRLQHALWGPPSQEQASATTLSNTGIDVFSKVAPEIKSPISVNVCIKEFHYHASSSAMPEHRKQHADLTNDAPEAEVPEDATSKQDHKSTSDLSVQSVILNGQKIYKECKSLLKEKFFNIKDEEISIDELFKKNSLMLKYYIEKYLYTKTKILEEEYFTAIRYHAHFIEKILQTDATEKCIISLEASNVSLSTEESSAYLHKAAEIMRFVASFEHHAFQIEFGKEKLNLKQILWLKDVLSSITKTQPLSRFLSFKIGMDTWMDGIQSELDWNLFKDYVLYIQFIYFPPTMGHHVLEKCLGSVSALSMPACYDFQHMSSKQIKYALNICTRSKLLKHKQELSWELNNSIEYIINLNQSPHVVEDDILKLLEFLTDKNFSTIQLVNFNETVIRFIDEKCADGALYHANTVILKNCTATENTLSDWRSRFKKQENFIAFQGESIQFGTHTSIENTPCSISNSSSEEDELNAYLFRTRPSFLNTLKETVEDTYLYLKDFY
jgi:hypothetical protein